jgi:transcriptional regulator with XRE-family HTH domain
MVGNDFDKQLGLRLAKLREERGWSQEQLREKAGVERRETITQWENGARKIKAEHILLLCEAFGISADYLLGLSDDPYRTPSAVDDLSLSPEAIIGIKRIKMISEETFKPDITVILSMLDRILCSDEFLSALIYVCEAAAEVSKTVSMYNTIEDEAKKNMLFAQYRLLSADNEEQYLFKRFQATQRFTNLLDIICDYEAIENAKANAFAAIDRLREEGHNGEHS